jgi:hypothetical protein
MEISPISGIRALPVLKAQPSAPELAPLSDIEELGRIGDETYTPSDGESAGGAEDDEEELIELNDPLELDDPEQAASTPTQAVPGRAISFFA